MVIELAEVVGDELLGGTAAAAAVGHFPAHAGDAQFFWRQLDAFFAQHVVDDGEVFFLVGGVVLDDQAEAVGEGDGLVHAVVAVDVVLARCGRASSRG